MKERRTETLKLLVTKKEKEEVRKKAEEQKLDLSNYLRTKIFKK